MCHITMPDITMPDITMCDKAVLAAGLGDAQAQFIVYIANRPNYQDYSQLDSIYALEKGDIERINQACGNGWRKVFNVYAKLLFALKQTNPAGDLTLPGIRARDWQSYRDNSLLQANSNTSLLFSAPCFATVTTQSTSVHIVMGRTYARTLKLSTSLIWLDHEFACDPTHRVLVCPYFDYRQLSDRKILHLVDLIATLTPIKLD